jgi:hypothetical protein
MRTIEFAPRFDWEAPGLGSQEQSKPLQATGGGTPKATDKPKKIKKPKKQSKKRLPSRGR